MKIITLFLLLFASFASAADDSWRNVETTANPAEMTTCTYLTEVTATASYVVVTPSADKHAAVLALKRLMILADRAGGDSLYITDIQVENGRARMTGMALDCWADR